MFLCCNQTNYCSN